MWQALRRRDGATRARRSADYALAFALSGLALLLRKLLPIEPVVGLYPLPLAAIIVSAWLGGRGPGLLAVLVSALGIAYWFIPPVYSLAIDPASIIGFAIFVAVAVLAIEFSMARRRAELALRESEAYLAESQRLSHTGSWAWAPATGELKYLSEECRKILGLDPEVRVPRFASLIQLAHAVDRDRVQDELDRAIAERADFELEYRNVRPDDTTRDIYAVGHPVFDASGELVEVVGTVLDVTERKQAEEERERLREAQAELEHINRVTTMGELTASLAHEIRQPIAAAITNAKTCLRWLERERPEFEEARAAASRMAGDAARAADIISRVRLLFKKGAHPRDWIDVNTVVGEMVVLLRGEARRQSVSIRTDLAALPRIVADRVQLQQVLMNLMLNGIDAMKNVGTRELTIRSRAGDGGCVITVTDTGPGIPAADAGRIFDAFFTTKPDGTGMGLSISRSIIEAHGGRLWADAGSGPGAAFHFMLPAEAETLP